MRSAARSRRRARRERPRASSMRSSSRYTARNASASGASGRWRARRALSHPADANSSMVRVSDAQKPGASATRANSGWCDAPRGLFDEEVEHSVGRLRPVGGPGFDEGGERLDEVAAEDEAFARESILQVLGEGGGGHEQAHLMIARAQCLAQTIEDGMGFAGSRRACEQPHGSSVAMMWRTHSCVPCRHSWRHSEAYQSRERRRPHPSRWRGAFLNSECRQECRHGTQECVRHIEH